MEQMINRALRLKNTLAGACRGVIRGSMLPQSLASGAAALLMALYSPVEGVAPFGVGCVVGVWYAGVSPYFACLGAIAGCLAAGNYAYAGAALLIGAAIALTERIGQIQRIYRVLTAFSVQALTLCTVAAMAREPLFYALGGSCVSTLSALVLGNGMLAAGRLTGKRSPTDTEVLSMAAGVGLVTLCFGSRSLWGQSPAMVFAGIAVMLSARRCGIASAAFAVAAGAGRVPVTGGDMHVIAVLAAAALFASALRSFGKAPVMLGFAAISLLFRLSMSGTGMLSVIETALACLLFMLIPERLYMPSDVTSEATPRPSASAGCSALTYRIGDLAGVLGELARVFGGSDGRLLGCVSQTLSRCVQCSVPKARALRYGALAAAAECKKEGSSQSGDSCIIKYLDERLLLCISDGMGSGEAARRESRETVGMLSDLLTVGFDIRSAAECVNRLMLMRAGGDMYATLDALLLDRTDGSASILKLGAPPSYVLRGGRLCTLYAENLPVGIVEKAEGPVRKVALLSGDRIVLLSDGVAEALGSGLAAVLTDELSQAEEPGSAAQKITAAARERGAADDMTVLVAFVE